jgi:hypothetical protein
LVNVGVGDEFVRTVVCDGAFGFIGKEQLLKLKLKAMRAGVWFRGLPRIDRVLVDLTIKVAQCIRSPSLASCILSVVRKVDDLLESRFARGVREIGFSLSRRVSLFAQGWGNKAARSWAGDEDFARYLAVMRLNG